MQDPNQIAQGRWPPVSSIIVGVAAVIMATTLAWGIAGGDFSSETAALMSMHWGVVSLVEIYVGIILFGCWVFWREANVLRSIAWVVLIALVGNLVSCVYILLALRAARGDVTRFWMGQRAAGREREVQ